MRSIISEMTRRSAVGGILSTSAVAMTSSAGLSGSVAPASRGPLPNELGRAYAEAWSSRRPERVASFYADDGQIVVNKGEAIRGRAAIANMAAGFYTAFPDMVVQCDDFRLAGMHALFAWTLDGHHAETKHRVRVRGWEEWDLNAVGKIVASRGWFEAADYENQIAGRASPL